MLELKNYYPVTVKDSSTIGYANFYIPEDKLHLNGCRYMRKKNGGVFVSYPSKTIEKNDGEFMHIPYFCYEKERNNRFQSSALKLIQQRIENNTKDTEVDSDGV